MGPCLLVVLAHPDDETFLCGGALAAFAAAGGRAHLVCATRGEHGRRLGVPPFANRESLPELREQELRSACAALGIAELHFMGLRDKCLEFEDEDDLAAQVALHVRRLRPDGMLTFHERRGGHTDHCSIGRAAATAWRRAGDAAWHPEHAAQGLTAYAPPRLYRLASRELARDPRRHGLQPEQITAVDVSPVAERKLAAFRAHRSQTGLDRSLWTDEESTLQGRFRGVEYFEQVAPPFVAGEDGLLGLSLRAAPGGDAP